MSSKVKTQRAVLLGSGSSHGRSTIQRVFRRGAEPLLLPAAGAVVIGLHVLAAGQIWRRMLLPAVGPLEALPPITHRAARPPEGPSSSQSGQSVTFAHELRRRLAALRVLSEAIELRSAKDDVDRLVHLLVRELHDLEQLESAMLGGGRRDALEEVDVLEVAKAAAQTVGWARKSEIRVQGSKRPMRVRLNATMLRQALENLIDNAATCGTGEPVDVIVRHSMARRLAGIEVMVADRGPGLGRAPATRRSGGGVGLPLVRKFVQESAGRLWSNNREGGGAVFGVWLPAVEGLSAAGRGPQGQAQPAGGRGANATDRSRRGGGRRNARGDRNGTGGSRS